MVARAAVCAPGCIALTDQIGEIASDSQRALARRGAHADEWRDHQRAECGATARSPPRRRDSSAPNQVAAVAERLGHQRSAVRFVCNAVPQDAERDIWRNGRSRATGAAVAADRQGKSAEVKERIRAMVAAGASSGAVRDEGARQGAQTVSQRPLILVAGRAGVSQRPDSAMS